MTGYSKCPAWLREAYRKAVKFQCENCHKFEKEVGTLQVHRIRRRSEKGLYEPHNCKIICSFCHKKIHANEVFR